MNTIEQGPRQPHDGPVRVEELPDGSYMISAEHHGQMQRMNVGKFNLFRLFAVIAMLLGLSLPAKLMRSIKL